MLQQAQDVRKKSAAPDGGDNDDFPTPVELALRVYQHFKPYGTVLEPCPGETSGFTVAYFQLLPEQIPFSHMQWPGDFLDETLADVPCRYDWIITNPPWSKVRDFMDLSMQISENVVFLMPMNKIDTKSRLNLIEERGFRIKEIARCDTPKSFPSSGFQLAAIHLKYKWRGKCGITRLRQLEPNGKDQS